MARGRWVRRATLPLALGAPVAHASHVGDKLVHPLWRGIDDHRRLTFGGSKHAATVPTQPGRTYGTRVVKWEV
jgi:hypothetical protein